MIIYFRGNSGTRGMFSSSMPSNLSSRGRNLSGGLPGQDELYNFHLDGVPPYGEVDKNAYLCIMCIQFLSKMVSLSLKSIDCYLLL